jgi:hypothetical protein
MYMDSTIRTGTTMSTADRGLLGSGANTYGTAGNIKFKIPSFIGGNLEANSPFDFDTTLHVVGTATFSGQANLGIKGGIIQFDKTLSYANNGGTVYTNMWVNGAFTPKQNTTYKKEVRLNSTLGAANPVTYNGGVYFAGNSGSVGAGETNVPLAQRHFGEPYNAPLPPVDRFDSTKLPGYVVPGFEDATVAAMGALVDIDSRNYGTTACAPIGTVPCTDVPAHTVNGVSLPAGKMLPAGYYGTLTGYTETIYLGEGVYYFNRIALQNSGSRLIALQTTGARTIVFARNGFSTNSGNIFVGPDSAIGATGYGSGPKLFMGGTMMLVAGNHAGIRFDSDALIWATLSAPTGTIYVNSQLTLYGQMFGRHFNAVNNFNGGAGEFVPFDPEKPVINISISPFGTRVPEADQTYYASIKLSNKNAYAVSFKYSTAVTPSGAPAGTAVAGTNFVSRADSVVVIKAGDTTAVIPFTVKWDHVVMGDLTFYLNFTDPAGGVFGVGTGAYGDTSHVAAQITIIDRDHPPALRAGDISAYEGDSGTTDFRFNVFFVDSATGSAYSGSVARDIQFFWKTSPLSASAWEGDYQGVTMGTVTATIPKGQTSTTVVVKVNGDRRYEPNENFKILLDTASLIGKVALGSGWNRLEAVGTILNDDSMPQVRMDNIGLPEGTSGRISHRLVAYLVDPKTNRALDSASSSQYPTRYSWVTSDGTAGNSLTGTVGDTDYVAIASNIRTIPAGKWTDTLSVSTIGDLKFEADETFKIELTGLDSAKKGTYTATATVLNDDNQPIVELLGGSVQEGKTGDRNVATFTVRLRSQATGELLVPANAPTTNLIFEWSTFDSTAVGMATGSSDSDFVRVVTRRDTIYAGSVSKTLSVTIVGDNRLEANEAFSVRLSNLVNAAPPEKNTTYAAMTILSEDAQPRVRVTADSIVREGNAGDRRPSTFTVQLLDATGAVLPPADAPQLPVSFTWKTVDSSAKTSVVGISDSDFVQVASDSVTMVLGAVKTTLTVRVKGDIYAEDTLEFFKVLLTPNINLSSAGSVLGAVGTIRDDDQPPVLTLTGVRQLEGNAGVSSFVISANLNEISARTIHFDWSTIEGTATVADADYQIVTNRRDSIPSGRLTPLLPLSVYVNGDTRLENDETFSVKVTNLAGATFAKNGTIDRDTVVSAILNDDAKPFLFVKNAVSVLERTPTATPDTLRFPVTFLDSTGNVVTAPLGVDVSYTWSTVDSAGDRGARSTDNDFVAQTSVVRTIVAGRPLLDTIKVVVTPDAKLEYDESFRVVVLSATNADTTSAAANAKAKGMSTALGTILNDDAKPRITVSNDTVQEPALSTDPDSLLSFVVSMDAPAGIPVTVNYLTEGVTATPDGSTTGDYNDTAGTLTFSPGQTTKTVSVKVHGDNIYEGSTPELVRFRLLGGNGNAQIARDTALGFIKDNDVAPILHVSSDTVREGESAIFTISLVDSLGKTAMSSLDVSVDWATQGVTATAGTDYVGHSPATTITIPAMTNSQVVQVVTLTDNLANEGVERFRLLITNPVNAIIKDTGIGYIVDVTSKPQVTINDTIVSEADGNAIFTIRLDRPSATALTFTWSTANNTDKIAKLRARFSGADSNYLAQTNVTLTIPAFGLVGVANVQLNDNNLDEPDTLFYWAKLRNASGSDTGVVVKDSIGVGGILDDDAPPTISVTDTTVTEPLTQTSTPVKARFFIKLSAPSAKDITGTWTTIDGTASSVVTSTASADFKAASGTFSIIAGKIADSVLIDIYGDTLDEVSETFRVKLLTSSNAPIIATDSVGNGTILDEDPLPSIFVRDTALNEPKTGTITYKLFAYLNRRSSKTISVNWATADAGGVGTTTAGADYVAGSGVLTFNPGDTVKTMSVTINSDAIANESVTSDGTTYYELFKINLTNLVNVARGDTTATDTIIDSDDRPFVSIDSVTITEKDSLAYFHVSFDIVSAIPVNITYATSDVTAKAVLDYTAKSDTLKIPAGKLKDSIGVQFKGDLLHENTETFLLNLLTSLQAKFANKTGLGTIIDNDVAPTLSVFDSAAAEPTAAGASGLMTFRLRLSAASGLPVTYKWGTADSSAQTIRPPFDYIDTGSTMTMPAGMTETTVSVRILGDSLYEGSERFKLQLTSLAGATFAGNDSIAIGTLTDSDPLPKVYIDSQTVKESETAVFKVRMERESGLPMALSWSVLAGTAVKDSDYVDTTGTLVINAGDLTGFVGVRTRTDNISGEGVETFKVLLKNLVGGAVGADTGLGRILDTNSLPLLSIDSVLDVREKDTTVYFTVRLTGAPSAVPVNVTYATREGTALAGVRFADTSGVLTIPARATSGKIGVRILNNQIREPETEFYTLVLNSADSARISKPIGLGSVIDDNDFPSVGVTNADTVAESGASVFVFQMVGSTKDTVRVWWHTVDGTAKSGLDYTADSGEVVFLPGRKQASVSVVTLADNLWEPTEGFSIRIDRLAEASSLVAPVDSLAKAWIRDEGAVPSVRFLSSDTTVREDASDSVSVRLALSRPASIDIKVVVPRQVGTANFGTTLGNGVDFTVAGLALDTLVFKAGDSLASFKVHVAPDSTDEYDETAIWKLVPIAPITLGGKYDYTLTIQDDDSVPLVRFVRDTQWTTESDSVRVAAKLSRVSAKDIEVWYSSTGTATPGIDDNRRPGAHEVLLFKAGTDTASFMLRTYDDNISEGKEVAVFKMDSTKHVDIDPAHAIDSVYIVDNDPLPVVSFVRPDTTVSENVGAVTFELRLSNPASYTVVVNVKGLAGTATLDSLRKGSDVFMDSSTVYKVVFAPGDTLASFSLRILDDGRVEPKENFFLKMFSEDARPKDSAKVAIVDNDRYPDVKITRPTDSVHVSDPKQSIAWTVDGAPQTVSDTSFVSGWNLVTRNFTDTAGNYDADSVMVWGDFTPPSIQVFKITGPNTHDSAKDTTWWGDKARTRFGRDTIWYWVRDSIQNADGNSWRVVVDTHSVVTDFKGDGLFPTQVRACDSVGNCAVDTGWIDLKQSKPVVSILTPPDGSQAVAGTLPVIHQVTDLGKTWDVSSTKTISTPGIDTILRCYEDDVGNRGCDVHKVVVKPVQVISATYLDLNGDGRVDAVLVNLDSRWSADSLPSFDLTLNDSSRTGQKPNAKTPYYAGPSRGTPIVNGKDTTWVSVGTYLLDSAGQILKGIDGFPLTNVLGDTVFGTDGKPKRDSLGRILYKVPGPGQVDSTRLLVAIVPPFPFGMTGFDVLQGAKMVASWTTKDSVGKPTVTKYVDAFKVDEKVPPVIVKAEIHRVENYDDPDTLFVTASEYLRLGKGGDLLQVGSCGAGIKTCAKADLIWKNVPDSMVTRGADGRYWFLVYPTDMGIKPDYQVRFRSDISDLKGNVIDTTNLNWSTVVTGAPRPDLVIMDPPSRLPSIPGSERDRTGPGGILIRTTKGVHSSDNKNKAWWEPGTGYVTGGAEMDRVRSICPNEQYCNGPTVYVNRPARMIMYIYDLAGTFVMTRTINISKDDLAKMEPDQLDRVSIELDWNHRNSQGKLVASGIYVWRIVSYLQVDGVPLPVMTNQLYKVGVKIQPPGGIFY